MMMTASVIIASPFAVPLPPSQSPTNSQFAAHSWVATITMMMTVSIIIVASPTLCYCLTTLHLTVCLWTVTMTTMMMMVSVIVIAGPSHCLCLHHQFMGYDSDNPAFCPLILTTC